MTEFNRRGALGRAPAILAATLVAAALSACAADAPPALAPALTLAEQGGSRPTAAVDPRTNTVYVAWVGSREGVSNVYLSRLDAGASGTPAPVRVNHLPGDAAPHDQAPPRVAVGAGGEVYVVWQNNTRIEGRRFPASDLRFARSTDGGRTFEPAITVNDDTGGEPASHTFHDMAVGADGAVYVSWIDSRERGGEGKGEASGSGHGHGQGHGNGHGDHGNAPGPDIRLARSTDGGRTFEPSRVVDRGACPCCRTALAVAPDGAVYVAWRKVFDGNIRDIVVARADAGEGAFRAPVRVHADDWRFDACPHAGPALAVAPDGRVHVGWYTGRESGAGLYYAISDDRADTFRTAAAIMTGDGLPPSQILLAANEQGQLSIVWEDRQTPERTLRFAHLREGGRPARSLALPGAAPALAAAGETTAVAWLEGEAVRVRVGR